MADRPRKYAAKELIERNAEYRSSFGDADLTASPTLCIAIVACMDSRMDIFGMLGLANGEAHIIRNAGGVVTDDTIRSLCLSQRKLGTCEIILIHHTDCGLTMVTEDEFFAQLESETGERPTWALQDFTDVDEDVRESIRRLQESPFLVHRDQISGFVYDVATGQLRPVAVSW